MKLKMLFLILIITQLSFSQEKLKVNDSILIRVSQNNYGYWNGIPPFRNNGLYFNSTGNIIKYTSKNKGYKHQLLYNYDATGMLTNLINKSFKNGKDTGCGCTTKYTYNENKLLVDKTTSYTGENSMILQEECFYDSQNRLSKKTTFYPSENYSQYELFKFDEEGKLVISMTYWDSKNTKENIIINNLPQPKSEKYYIYKEGVLQKIEQGYNDKITAFTNILYNSNGTIDRINIYNTAGLIRETILKYDKNIVLDSNLIEKINKEIIFFDDFN